MRTFREKLRDIESDPEKWEAVSAHTEKSSRKGGRKHGSSTQTIYKNKDTGETIVRHTVQDDIGRVIDDHFVPTISHVLEIWAMHDKRSTAPPQQSELQMFVLDVLRHDAVEQASSIVRLLNDASSCVGWREFWPHDFTVAEVVGALLSLEHEGYIAALRESSEDDNLLPIPAGQLDASACQDAWFVLTDHGRDQLDHWDPPTI